jgi:hypothetical protein
MDQRAFEMTPDKTAAEKILAADFRNIIKKVKAGTPLSKSERDIVKHWEAEQPKPTPKASNAKSKQAVPPAKEAAQRIVESMQAAASLVGYRIEAIQAAKAAGCVAFKPGNRINLFELEEWFALHPEVTSVNQSDMTIAQALTMETVAKALTRRETWCGPRKCGWTSRGPLWGSGRSCFPSPRVSARSLPWYRTRTRSTWNCGPNSRWRWPNCTRASGQGVIARTAARRFRERI